MNLTPYLLHTNMTKDDNGVYHFTMRTIEGAYIIKKRSEAKGIKVNIRIEKAPKYFKSKEDYLSYLLSNNQVFKEFYDTLGLEMIE